MSPEAIGKLNLYQIRLLCTPKIELEETAEVGDKNFKAVERRNKRKRKRQETWFKP